MNSVVKNSLLFAGGLLVGGAVGYVVSLYQMKKQVDTVMDMVDDEFAKMKVHYEKKYKMGAYSTPESAVDALLHLPEEQEKKVAETILNKRLTSFGYIEDKVIDNEDWDAIDEVDGNTSGEGEPVAEPETLSIFDRAVTDEEAGEEIDPDTGETKKAAKKKSRVVNDKEEDTFFADRDINKALHKPYLITVEEFQTDDDYDKVELMYFEGDDTLMDDREKVIDDIEAVIGIDSLNEFGNHSDDRDIVYVRNANWATDYEVHRNKGEYAVSILGMSPAKEKTKLRKMRDDE